MMNANYTDDLKCFQRVFREFGRWKGMHNRCYRRTNQLYPNYGGRGIKICQRWHKFENFLSDMGYAPPGLTIDRIDNDGDYEPVNCRWATPTEQANNLRSNRIIEHDGRSLTISQWAREVGLGPETIAARLRLGWTVTDALSRPTQERQDLIRLTHDDRTQTINEWSAETGIHRHTIFTRLDEGWSAERALTTPILKHDMEVDGVVKTVSQAARDAGISRTTLQTRMRKGISEDQVLDTPVLQKKLWTYKGETKTVHAWAEQFGFNYKGLMARYKRGWSAERALESPMKDFSGKQSSNQR